MKMFLFETSNPLDQLFPVGHPAPERIPPQLIFIPLTLLGCLRTLAVDKVWKVNGNGVWGTNGRWTPSGIPGSGDRAVFNETPTVGNEPVVTSTRVVDSLLVTSSNIGPSSVALTATAGTLQITTAGTPDIEIQFGNSLSLNGTISGTGFEGLDLNVAGSLIVQSGSTISSAGSMALTGGGTLTLNSGTLTPGGASGGVNVSGAGTTLAGTGTVNGALAFFDNSILSPGGGGFGTITVEGDLYATNPSAWVFDATSLSSKDGMTVTGDLNVSQFSLDLSGVASSGFSPGDSVVIATYGNTTNPVGIFASVTGLPAGWSIDYGFNGNSIALTTVPEISHACPLLAALVPLFSLRNRRKRR